jgi:hypothetical protein
VCEEIHAPDHFFPPGRRFSSLLLAAQREERKSERERGEMGEAVQPNHHNSPIS